MTVTVKRFRTEERDRSERSDSDDDATWPAGWDRAKAVRKLADLGIIVGGGNVGAPLSDRWVALMIGALGIKAMRADGAPAKFPRTPLAKEVRDALVESAWKATLKASGIRAANDLDGELRRHDDLYLAVRAVGTIASAASMRGNATPDDNPAPALRADDKPRTPEALAMRERQRAWREQWKAPTSAHRPRRAP